MIAVGVIGVLAFAFVAGYLSSKTWLRFALVCLTGFALMGLLLFVLWFGGLIHEYGLAA